MDASSFCLLMTATLSVQPDRFQFFRYDTFTLSCSVKGDASGWTLRRNTSSGSFQQCQKGWGRLKGSSCSLYGVYLSDTGVYWCESERGEKCSNILNITVNPGTVILESPTVRVEDGAEVTLRCSHRGRYDVKSTSDFNAAFYRDGSFIGNRPQGKMILQSVSKKDEGSYWCQHPSAGASPQSPLVVTDRPEPTVVPTPPPPVMSWPRLLCTILLFLIYVVITILCIHLYRKRAQARAEAKRRDAVRLVAAR